MKMPKKASNTNNNDNNDQETIPQTPPPNPNRCQFETSDGRRCRMLRYNAHPTLCLFHAHDEMQLLESQRIGAELSASLTGQFMTATDINFVLGKLFTATAQNRIPPRTAAILAYIGQLMLHSPPASKTNIPSNMITSPGTKCSTTGSPYPVPGPPLHPQLPLPQPPQQLPNPRLPPKASAPATASIASSPSTAPPSTPTTSPAPATAPQASTPTAAPAPTTAPKPSARATAPPSPHASPHNLSSAPQKS